MDKQLWALVIVNALYLLAFGVLAFMTGNGEFLLYVFIVVGVASMLLWSLPYTKMPSWLLWLLTLWGFGHLAGGLWPTSYGVLYSNILIPIVGEPYNVLKYDQFLHLYGFIIASMGLWYILRPQLANRHSPFVIAFFIFFTCLGIGGLNEVMEFFVTVLFAVNYVGGYENTALDLLSNAVGSLIGSLIVGFKLAQNP